MEKQRLPQRLAQKYHKELWSEWIAQGGGKSNWPRWKEIKDKYQISDTLCFPCTMTDGDLQGCLHCPIDLPRYHCSGRCHDPYNEWSMETSKVKDRLALEIANWPWKPVFKRVFHKDELVVGKKYFEIMQNKLSDRELISFKMEMHPFTVLENPFKYKSNIINDLYRIKVRYDGWDHNYELFLNDSGIKDGVGDLTNNHMTFEFTTYEDYKDLENVTYGEFKTMFYNEPTPELKESETEKKIKLTEEKEMEDVSTTKSRVLSAARKCPDAKNVLQELFPSVFPEPRKFRIGDHFKIRGDNSYGSGMPVYVLAQTGNNPTTLPVIRLINMRTGSTYQENPIPYKKDSRGFIYFNEDFERKLIPVEINIAVLHEK